ncbi:MAG: 16S rRNA (guanine(527)-N(7))-methyltransferase RsmG [Firmicutes bacterium]|nr:16S rRNA (guanine(527)-N(7))-methyltransferase RsmG [Bacillota bacterium]
MRAKVDQELEVLAAGARELGIVLGPEQQDQFRRYAELLLEWNKKTNLVRIKSLAELFRNHFLDSLWCAAGCAFRDGHRLLDLGSGAGFPGIPLKISFPGVRVFLLEAQRKRCAFLQEVCRALELDACTVLAGRAEDLGRLPGLRAAFDRVVVRALARLPVILELGLPFLLPGGLLVALKGRDVERELEEARAALEVLGGEVARVIPYRFPGEVGRHVVTVRKVAPTPDGYPRRAGIPARRPLCGGGKKRGGFGRGGLNRGDAG